VVKEAEAILRERIQRLAVLCHPLQVTGLREEIGEVYGEVMRYGGRPTQSQMDRAAVLEGKVADAGKTFDDLSSSSDGLTDALKAQKLDPLKKLSKEEYDKRP
jgi:hypothetical protein